jgi:hypothetical protein
LDSLRQLDPFVAVALLDRDPVADRIEDASQVEIAGPVLELGTQRRERPDGRPELSIRDENAKRDIFIARRPFKQGVERKLEILEVLERQVETHCKAAEDEVRNAVKRLVRRQRQSNLVNAQKALQSDPEIERTTATCGCGILCLKCG